MVIKVKTFDFIGKSKIFFTLSLTILVICIACVGIFGVDLDIQFKGGAIITYQYEGDLDTSAFTQEVKEVLDTEVSVQDTVNAITGRENFVVSLAADTGLAAEKQFELTDVLKATYPDNNIEMISSNVVDPTIGNEFLLKCLVAVAFAAVLMIVYVGIRFSSIGGYSAGCMAVVALLHDIMVVFATFVVFRIPINDSFIAVVLTILGYSLNDTIVIYDRIRENNILHPDKNLKDLVNLSVSQSLGRSISTTVTTVSSMVIVCILAVIYNVDSIFTFALPMIVGMLSGVYSSICIAGPLWVIWRDKHPQVEIVDTKSNKSGKAQDDGFEDIDAYLKAEEQIRDNSNLFR